MNIGFFTDTYFPQISGVATSIKILKDELEKLGNNVYIFTTTDPNVKNFNKKIIRLPSIPFIYFKDRRMVIRGMKYSYLLSKKLKLDLIHTHTEFGVGILGKIIGNKLKIPLIHTYHTMYEDYLHYIAKGRFLKPFHVKYFSKMFVNQMSGIICPSKKVVNKLLEYGIKIPMKIIPTGINIKKFNIINKKKIENLKKKLKISKNTLIFLTLSRISYEKNIQFIIKKFPELIKNLINIKLIIVGKGPYLKKLKTLVNSLKINKYIIFIGEVKQNEVILYYKISNYFISVSDSESQGLIYLESIVSKTPCIFKVNNYLKTLFNNKALGIGFLKEDDFINVILKYIKKNYKINEKYYNKKLKEISSKTFVNSVLKFYNEIIIFYKKNINNKINTFQKIKLKFLKFKKKIRS